MAKSDTTLTIDEMSEEVNCYGVVWTHTHYGRGFRPSNAEMIANIQTAFNFAKAISDEIYFVVDEDAGFAIKGMCDSFDWDNYAFDQTIISEHMALMVYWENYGFASDTPEDWVLRSEIAKIVGIDERHLQEPQ